MGKHRSCQSRRDPGNPIYSDVTVSATPMLRLTGRLPENPSLPLEGAIDWRKWITGGCSLSGFIFKFPRALQDKLIELSWLTLFFVN